MANRVLQRLTGYADPAVQRNFGLEALHAAMAALFLGSTVPFLPVVAIGLGATQRQAAWVAVVPYVGYLASIAWSWVGRGGRQLGWLIWPTLAWRLGFTLLAFVSRPGTLVVSLLLLQLVLAASYPAYPVLMQRIYPAAVRGRLMGYIRVVLVAGTLPATYLAGWLIHIFGHRWVFVAGGAIGVAAVLGTYARIREPKPDAAAEPSAVPPHRALAAGWLWVREDPELRRMVLAICLIQGGFLICVPFYPFYQVTQLQFDSLAVGWVSVLWSLSRMAGYLFWSRIVDRLGPWVLLLGASAGFAAEAVAYAAWGTAAAAMSGAVARGVAESAGELGMWSWLVRRAPRRTGVYTALVLGLHGLLALSGPVLGSPVAAGAGFRWLFLAGGLAATVGGALAWRWGRLHRPPAGMSRIG